jgi:cytoskeletal protein RodZ
MATLGEEFRSAREARGLSLSDVAERLHIRSVYLAAIEDEDWKAIGAPVYVRGFMRTYARFLGLDAEAAVARFSSAAPATPAAPGATRSEERPRVRERRSDRTGPSVLAILAVLVAVAVVAYVGYTFMQYRPGAGPAVAAASPGAVADAPATDASPDVAATATPPPAAPVAHATVKRGLHLQLTQASWLRLTIDGTVVVEGTFPAGTAKSFHGKSADLRVGNAGGVEVAINGRPVGPLGASGDVVERHFDLSGE